jgi:hypothetical protein
MCVASCLWNISMCVYAYIHIYIYTYIHIYIYIYICILCVCVCAFKVAYGTFTLSALSSPCVRMAQSYNTCIHTYVPVHTCMETYIHMYLCTNACMYTCMCVCTSLKYKLKLEFRGHSCWHLSTRSLICVYIKWNAYTFTTMYMKCVFHEMHVKLRAVFPIKQIFFSSICNSPVQLSHESKD